MLEPYSDQGVAGSSLGEAAHWVEQLLLGQMGVAVAVLAVGLVGFRMLLGFASPREMGRILLGCFILFGAPSIARALIGVPQLGHIEARNNALAAPLSVSPALPSSVPQMPPTTINPFDPYIGSTAAH